MKIKWFINIWHNYLIMGLLDSVSFLFFVLKPFNMSILMSPWEFISELFVLIAQCHAFLNLRFVLVFALRNETFGFSLIAGLEWGILLLRLVTTDEFPGRTLLVLLFGALEPLESLITSIKLIIYNCIACRKRLSRKRCIMLSYC